MGAFVGVSPSPKSSLRLKEWKGEKHITLLTFPQVMGNIGCLFWLLEMQSVPRKNCQRDVLRKLALLKVQLEMSAVSKPFIFD